MPAVLASGSGRTISLFEQVAVISPTSPLGANNAYPVYPGDTLVWQIVTKSATFPQAVYPPDTGLMYGGSLAGSYPGQHVATAIVGQPANGVHIVGSMTARNTSVVPGSPTPGTVQATLFCATGGMAIMRWFSLRGGGKGVNSYATAGTYNLTSIFPIYYNLPGMLRSRTLASAAISQGYTRTNFWFMMSASVGAAAPAIGGSGIIGYVTPAWNRLSVVNNSTSTATQCGSGVVFSCAGDSRSSGATAINGYYDTTAPQIQVAFGNQGYYHFVTVSVPCSG